MSGGGYIYKMKNSIIGNHTRASFMAVTLVILLIITGWAYSNTEKIKAFLKKDVNVSEQSNINKTAARPEADTSQYLKAGSGDYDIVFALDSWIGGTPLIYALDNGFDKKHTLRVGIEAVYDEKTKMQGLKEGKFQAVELALPVYLSMLKEYPGCGIIMAITDFSHGSDGLVTKPEIKDLKQIKGKRVVYLSDGISKYSLAQFLSKAGLRYRDIVPVEKSSFNELFEEINNGNADAVVAADQTLFAIQNYINNDADCMRLLLSSKDISDFMPNVLVVNRDFAQRKPDTVNSFLEMWFDSVNAIMKYSDKSSLDILKASKRYPDIYGEVTEEDVKRSMEGIKLMSLKGNLEYFDIAGKSARLAGILSDAQGLLLESEGDIQEYNASNVFTPEFLKSVSKGTALQDGTVVIEKSHQKKK